MGGAPDINYAPPSAAESTEQMLKAFTAYLPGFMEVGNAQILPNELAQLAASRVVSPEYAELTKQIYETYGKDINRLSAENAGEFLKAQTQAAAENVAGPGREFVKEALLTARLADPEYFAAREQAGSALSSMLQGGLTRGEEEAVSRGLGREAFATGNAGRNSPAEAVAAGMQYGNMARDRLSQALNLATGVLPQLRTGVNPFEIRTANNQAAESRTGTAMQGLGQQSSQFANNLLNQTGENQRANISANTSLMNAQMGAWENPWSVGAGYAQAVGSAIGGRCWIARAVFGEHDIRWELFREWMYDCAPRWLQNYYTANAERLAPKVAKCAWLKAMLKPLMLLAINYKYPKRIKLWASGVLS